MLQPTYLQWQTISIHAPVKGATLHGSQLRHGHDISIHAPVKGATDSHQLGQHLPAISIHAPVKGATSIEVGRLNHVGISIHAPVKGATGFLPAGRTVLADFNPRTREGCDGRCSPTTGRRRHFNPRTREGCDEAGQHSLHTADEFQSTHP